MLTGGEEKLIKSALISSYLFLGLGAILGLVQAISRTPGLPKLLSAKLYYLSITTHGIVLAIAWTTFFIIGFIYYTLINALSRNMHSIKLAWASFYVTLLGVALAAAMLLSGNASVGWTFYAPLHAHPIFHVGLVLFVIGTWIFTAEVLLTVREWRKDNPTQRLPLAVHGTVATLFMWIIATIPLAFEEIVLRIPWALDPARGIDVELSRTLFWWFGHPLVYFWILPAVIVWYTYFPSFMGEKIYSDYFARVVFILFVIFSIPVGVHHQFQDPGFSLVIKYIFTLFTFFVGVPSLLTAFNIAATMERAGRKRGGKGLLIGWIKKLPWNEPAFTAIALALLLFAWGGITGFINAGYHLNAIVHNTIWIVGHFHTTVGGGATLTFIGVSYYIIPRLFRKKLYSRKLALLQAWSWFAGLLLFSVSTSIAGILGSPRRTYDVTYLGSEQAKAWIPYIQVSALGGTLMFIGVALFIAVIFLTMRSKIKFQEYDSTEKIRTPQNDKSIWNNFKLFAAVAFLLTFIVYVPSIMHLQNIEAPNVIGATPQGPFSGPAPGDEEIEPTGDAEIIQTGRALFMSKGCGACHSTDGRPGTGPTMKNAFGREVILEGGVKISSDYVYLEESILKPDAKTVEGYPLGLMSAVIPEGYISDEEADAIIAYIQTLK